VLETVEPAKCDSCSGKEKNKSFKIKNICCCFELNHMYFQQELERFVMAHHFIPTGTEREDASSSNSYTTRLVVDSSVTHAILLLVDDDEKPTLISLPPVTKDF